MKNFPYAKPPQYHYQTFNRHTLQFTNHPVIDRPPPHPKPETVEPLEEEGVVPAKPLDGEEDAKDEPNEDGKEAESSTPAEVPETDAGLTILEMPTAAVVS